MTKIPVRERHASDNLQRGEVLSSSHFRCQAPPSTPWRQSS